jgi:hypothetical protein
MCCAPPRQHRLQRKTVLPSKPRCRAPPTTADQAPRPLGGVRSGAAPDRLPLRQVREPEPEWLRSLLLVLPPKDNGPGPGLRRCEGAYASILFAAPARRFRINGLVVFWSRGHNDHVCPRDIPTHWPRRPSPILELCSASDASWGLVLLVEREYGVMGGRASQG